MTARLMTPFCHAAQLFAALRADPAFAEAMQALFEGWRPGAPAANAAPRPETGRTGDRAFLSVYGG